MHISHLIKIYNLYRYRHVVCEQNKKQRKQTEKKNAVMRSATSQVLPYVYLEVIKRKASITTESRILEN